MGWGYGGMGVLVEDGLCRCWSRDAAFAVEQITSKLRRGRRTKYMYSWILGAMRERGQGATQKQAEKVWDFSI